jgi:hypothetical protein
VKDRVERLIDDRREMIHIPSDCLILDGVVCSGGAAPVGGSAHGRSILTGERRGFGA